MIGISVATVTITGITAMTQSHQHGEPEFEQENKDAYDLRTWRLKLNTEVRDGRPTIVIPGHGMHQSIAAAAKYSKRQIPGQGKATWTAKFKSGIMMDGHPSLNIDPESVGFISISANTDGIRGSGKRVLRRFPIIPMGWTTTFDVHVLDPIIIEPIFNEMVALAGVFIGLGQFRPENGGTNGRFKVNKIVWADNRQIAA